MRTHRQRGWMRRGFSLLWEPRVLAEILVPSAVMSVREFFAVRKGWPAELPGADGDALAEVVRRAATLHSA